MQCAGLRRATAAPSTSSKQVVVTPHGDAIKFDVDAFRKYCLINGLDDIGLTLRYRPTRSASLRSANAGDQPWLFALTFYWNNP
jgi:3-isopropylmalate dehydratase small subunit